jgi:hypothetical protein
VTDRKSYAVVRTYQEVHVISIDMHAVIELSNYVLVKSELATEGHQIGRVLFDDSVYVL